jgi:30S ribosomal protein S31
MGKGDKRTRKGKIYSASYGNARPHQKVTNGKPAAAAAAPAKKAAPAVKKVAGRKA